eukprot:CAMPEP_0174850772 /NCGR_PEP_ID=MMETSP1114-20130205/21130_1 /TAXON_ID=312471 /ORGANISM="Neobodo designis, Strain CCAP 1951/1" /LENGTH=790 /DNA_ID=CAMNT_0016085259 /DNA_START=195 /DNA_END=2567 /DNA_ORIENTATION=-
MTPPPPGMAPSKRQFVPNVVDAVMRSLPRGRPAATMAMPSVDDVTAAEQPQESSAAPSPTPAEQPRQNAPSAAKPSAAKEVDVPYSVADDLMTYTVEEFLGIGRNVANRDVPDTVAKISDQLWAAIASAGDRSPSPPPGGPLFGLKTPGRGGADAKDTPSRKKYFDKSELHHKVLAVLNKVTASDKEKYMEVRNELHRLPLPTASDEQLQKISEIFFIKATTEPKFAKEYAMLVAELAISPPGKSVGDTTKTLAHRLRTVLVSKCQSEFERTRTNLWHGDVSNEAEYDRLRHRYRETLRFVGHLYLRKILVPDVIRSIIEEIFPPYGVPADYDVDGAVTLILTVAEQLVKDDLDIVVGVFHRTRELSSAKDLAPRSHCLILNLRDELRLKVPESVAKESDALVPVANGPLNEQTLSAEDALEHARKIMSALAANGDYGAAVDALVATGDPGAVLYAGVGRALTTPRAEKERQQLPTLFRYLLERRVFEFEHAHAIVLDRCREAIENREWSTAPRLWRHLAQIFSEDKEDFAVLHQTLLTNVLYEVACSTTVEMPADLEQYVSQVLSVQDDIVWSHSVKDPVACPRFRYLAVIIATCSFDSLADEPLAIVKRLLAKDPAGKRHDIEAVLFCAMCERRFNDVFEEVSHHPQREHRLMTQKVMGAAVAAMVAMQDRTILDDCVDALHLVVDGPDRALREALILGELMEAGSCMLGQVRHQAFGFQVVKTLKDHEVVSETTIQAAHRVYAQHPQVMHLLGPRVAAPFVSDHHHSAPAAHPAVTGVAAPPAITAA